MRVQRLVSIGANGSDRPRPGLILEYVVSWLRPQETQLVAVPPEVARDLPERLQELIGYNVYPPFLGYVDGRHPRRALDPAHERADVKFTYADVVGDALEVALGK